MLRSMLRAVHPAATSSPMLARCSPMRTIATQPRQHPPTFDRITAIAMEQLAAELVSAVRSSFPAPTSSLVPHINPTPSISDLITALLLNVGFIPYMVRDGVFVFMPHSALEARTVVSVLNQSTYAKESSATSSLHAESAHDPPLPESKKPSIHTESAGGVERLLYSATLGVSVEWFPATELSPRNGDNSRIVQQIQLFFSRIYTVIVSGKGGYISFDDAISAEQIETSHQWNHQWQIFISRRNMLISKYVLPESNNRTVSTTSLKIPIEKQFPIDDVQRFIELISSVDDKFFINALVGEVAHRVNPTCDKKYPSTLNHEKLAAINIAVGDRLVISFNMDLLSRNRPDALYKPYLDAGKSNMFFYRNTPVKQKVKAAYGTQSLVKTNDAEEHGILVNMLNEFLCNNATELAVANSMPIANDVQNNKKNGKRSFYSAFAAGMLDSLQKQDQMCWYMDTANSMLGRFFNSSASYENERQGRTSNTSTSVEYKYDTHAKRLWMVNSLLGARYNRNIKYVSREGLVLGLPKKVTRDSVTRVEKLLRSKDVSPSILFNELFLNQYLKSGKYDLENLLAALYRLFSTFKFTKVFLNAVHDLSSLEANRIRPGMPTILALPHIIDLNTILRVIPSELVVPGFGEILSDSHYHVPSNLYVGYKCSYVDKENPLSDCILLERIPVVVKDTMESSGDIYIFAHDGKPFPLDKLRNAYEKIYQDARRNYLSLQMDLRSMVGRLNEISQKDKEETAFDIMQSREKEQIDLYCSAPFPEFELTLLSGHVTKPTPTVSVNKPAASRTEATLWQRKWEVPASCVERVSDDELLEELALNVPSQMSKIVEADINTLFPNSIQSSSPFLHEYLERPTRTAIIDMVAQMRRYAEIYKTYLHKYYFPLNCKDEEMDSALRKLIVDTVGLTDVVRLRITHAPNKVRYVCAKSERGYYDFQYSNRNDLMLSTTDDVKRELVPWDFKLRLMRGNYTRYESKGGSDYSPTFSLRDYATEQALVWRSARKALAAVDIYSKLLPFHNRIGRFQALLLDEADASNRTAALSAVIAEDERYKTRMMVNKYLLKLQTAVAKGVLTKEQLKSIPPQFAPTTKKGLARLKALIIVDSIQ